MREFLDHAFGHVGLDWHDHVRFDERYLRPTEVDALIGDPTKAHERLGWHARVDVKELAEIMVDADSNGQASAVSSARATRSST